MRINTTSLSFQRSAGLDQKPTNTILGVLNIQAQNFQCRGFLSTSEFHIGKQGTIATQATLSAEHVCQPFVDRKSQRVPSNRPNRENCKQGLSKTDGFTETKCPKPRPWDVFLAARLL